MGGLASYANGTKETWRGWMWNQVVSHLPEIAFETPWAKKGSARERSVTKTKTVLYLSGPEDLDRKVALSHGFCDENLIAIDRDGKAIEAVRKKRGIGVCGDIGEVAILWDSPIDVIVFDFCGGITDTTVEAYIKPLVISQSLHSETVVVTNLLRGRDPLAKTFADQIDANIEASDKKHRAKVLESYLLSKAYKASRDRSGMLYALNRLDDSLRWADFAYSSYMSPSGQVFDSAVFRNWHSSALFRDWRNAQQSPLVPTHGTTTEEEVSRLVKWIDGAREEVSMSKRGIKTKHRIAACKAIRTMRTN